MVNPNKHKNSMGELDGILRDILIPHDNPTDLKTYKMFFVFVGGVLTNNGYDKIFNIIGDKCGKTTVYNILKRTLGYAQRNKKRLTAKPFFIDDSVEYFQKYSYNEFASNFIKGNYTALIIDDLTFEHHKNLMEFFATAMEHKPMFFTMNSEEGFKLKEYMEFKKENYEF